MERLLDAFGDRRHVRGIGDLLHENRKLVSAKTRDRVGRADTPVQPAGHRHQQLIADHVPEAIVDRLELVDIHEEHRDRPLASPARLAAARSRSMNAVRFRDCVRPSCAARNDSCSSILFCAVMSRRNPVNIGGPAEGIREMDSSTGNSVPSARIAVVSKRRSIAAGGSRGEVARQALPVRGAQIDRDDQLGHVPAHDLRPLVAERSLRRRVEFDDAPAMIDGDDAVEHGLEHPGLPGFALRDLLLDFLSREELADLGADRREHLKQVGVRLAIRSAEELEHAEEVAARGDRKRERPVQPSLGGGFETGEIGILLNIDEP